MKTDDVDLFELNEPFAVQVLTWCDGVGVAPEDPRLNPYGGAITSVIRSPRPGFASSHSWRAASATGPTRATG